jgi:hypothetical protein
LNDDLCQLNFTSIPVRVDTCNASPKVALHLVSVSHEVAGFL